MEVKQWLEPVTDLIGSGVGELRVKVLRGLWVTVALQPQGGFPLWTIVIATYALASPVVGAGKCGLHHHRVYRGRHDGVWLVEGLSVPG